jgi:hypothetical protein
MPRSGWESSCQRTIAHSCCRSELAGPDGQKFDDHADLDAALEVLEERLAEMQYDPRFKPGALCLCTEGCGLMVWLVVTGSERGRMWRDPRCDDFDLYPMRDADCSPLDFAGWYLGWLAAVEAACSRGGLGRSGRGGESRQSSDAVWTG